MPSFLFTSSTVAHKPAPDPAGDVMCNALGTESFGLAASQFRLHHPEGSSAGGTAVTSVPQGEPGRSWPHEELLPLLTNHDPRVRGAAVLSLATSGRPGAAEAVVRLAGDQSQLVRDCVTQALCTLGQGAFPAIDAALLPRGILETVGFDPTGRRQHLAWVRRVIQFRHQTADPSHRHPAQIG